MAIAPGGEEQAQREAMLNRIYNDLFFRDVGRTGQEYWLSGEGSNVGIEQLRETISNAAIGDDARVNQIRQIYEDELYRTPEIGGLEYWSGVDINKDGTVGDPNNPGATTLGDFNQIRTAVAQSSEGIALDDYQTYLRDLAGQVDAGNITLDQAYDQAAADYKRLSESGQLSDMSLGRAINDVFADGAEEVATRLDAAIDTGGTDTGGTDTGGTDTGGTDTGGFGLDSLLGQIETLQGNYDSLLSQYEELRALLEGMSTGSGGYTPPFGSSTYQGTAITPYTGTPYSGAGGAMTPTVQQTPYTQLPQLQSGPSLAGQLDLTRPFGAQGTPEQSFLADPFSPATNVGYVPPPVYFPFAYQSG